MKIQAVLFDMGGTIETYEFTPELRIERTPGIQKRLLHVGIDLGLSNKELYEVISSGLARYRKYCLQSHEELSTQRVWSEYILPGFSIDQDALASIAEELMCYIETRYYHREMRPEMPEVLESIRKMGLKIALISNVNSRGQVPKNLTEYNIKQYFDPIVLSSEYGRRKPDPAIFHYAARLANVPISDCVHVGDRISRDILGARRAGIRWAVQIRHHFHHGEDDSGAVPDATIDKMTELLDFLREKMAFQNRVIDHKNQIRAILFDAGDILYFRSERGKYLQEFLTEIGIVFRQITESERIHLRDQAFIGLINQHQHHQAILRLYGVEDPELLERGCQAIQRDEDNVQFFEGVKEILHSLKESGFMLGIITDTANPVHVKLSWFERGGFGDVWDTIISSQEIGIEKPDPEIYFAALKQLGIEAEQAVFVGHSSDELEGARKCGIKTIAFNYESSAKADYYVEKFSDLINVSPIIKSSAITSKGKI